MVNEIVDELRSITAKNDGLLRPEDVIEHAKNKSSAMHNSFTWEDSIAAHEFRLEQARKLIRTQIQYLGENKEPVNVFVSLSTDRKQEGGGYRELVEVYANKTQREILLEDAKKDMITFTEKYKSLIELKEVILVIEQVRKRLK